MPAEEKPEQGRRLVRLVDLGHVHLGVGRGFVEELTDHIRKWALLPCSQAADPIPRAASMLMLAWSVVFMGFDPNPSICALP